MQIDTEAKLIDGQCLLVIVSGELDVEQMQAMFVPALDACVKEKATKIIFDFRGIWGAPSMANRFEFSCFMANNYLMHEHKHCMKFAFLLTKELIDPGKFGELVAVNRGLPGKAFTDSGELCRWLEIAEQNI